MPAIEQINTIPERCGCIRIRPTINANINTNRKMPYLNVCIFDCPTSVIIFENRAIIANLTPSDGWNCPITGKSIHLFIPFLSPFVNRTAINNISVKKNIAFAAFL